jgi:hypothetical protein
MTKKRSVLLNPQGVIYVYKQSATKEVFLSAATLRIPCAKIWRQPAAAGG